MNLTCFLQTASQILSSPVLNHALLFVNKSSAGFKEIHSAFKSAAEAFRLKVRTKHALTIYSKCHNDLLVDHCSTSPLCVSVCVFRFYLCW